MAICPIGHESGTDDYCEVCGRLMPGQGQGQPAPGLQAPGQQAPGQAEPPLPPPSPGVSPFPLAGDPEATAAVEVCPQCKTPREGQEPFCEGCRWNYITGLPGSGPLPPPLPSRVPPPSWSAVPPPPLPPQAQPVPHPGPQPPPGQTPPHAQTPPPVPIPPPPAPAPPPGRRPPQTPVPPHLQRQPEPSRVQPPFATPPAPAPGPPATPASGADFVIAPPSGGRPHPQAQPPLRQPADPAAQPPSWYVVVSADRDYFTTMMARSGPEAQGLFFPPYCPERRFELKGNQLRIGRMRHRPDEEPPEIDLSKPPEDPGVSHKHAVLVQQPDGTWAVVDQGSTNGTTVNGAEDPVRPYVPVQLKDGDRVHVGAWTTITVHRAEP